MVPKIGDTSFGIIRVENDLFDHDIVINLKGKVLKRKKKLSKAIYGTSHKVSLDEIKHIHEKGADIIVIGSGQYGRLVISNEAASYLKNHSCKYKLMPTPQAIDYWNSHKGKMVGMFHVTC